MTQEQPKPHDPGKKPVNNEENSILDDVAESLPTQPEPTDGPAPGA